MFNSARIFIVSILLTAFSIIPLYSSNLEHQDRKAAPLNILNITPSGEDVSPGRQIVFQFNRAVVPVGRMDRDEAEIPIDITPKIKGQWRWLDTDSLAFMTDMENQMHLATRYNITVKPGIMAEDGATIKQTINHSFTTARPKTERAYFKVWESPGMPFVLVSFNQPVIRSSVEKHLFFTITRNDRIKVNVIPDNDQPYTPRILPLPGENAALITDGKQPVKESENKARSIWVVYPDIELPLDTRAELIIEPGIESNQGPEKGVERRTVTTIDTIPSFTFIGASCYGSNWERVLIKSGDDNGKCRPGSVDLEFSSPVFSKDVNENININSTKSENDQQNANNYYEIDSIYRQSHRPGRSYSVNIQQTLGADKFYTINSKPAKIHDAFGRTLENPINLNIKTYQDHYNPYYHISSAPEVLEKNSNTELQVEVRNLDKLTFKYDRYNADGTDRHLSIEVPLPESVDKLIKIPAGVRKMLDGRSGMVQGIVYPTPRTRESYPVNFKVQVTRFHVHAKISYLSTLVWVTDMETGEPVQGAEVEIYKNNRDEFVKLSETTNVFTSGITDHDGVAMLEGAQKIYPASGQPGLVMVQVKKGEDIALLPLSYEFRNHYMLESREKCFIRAWGATSQGVYKPGDKVNYKIYVRDQDRFSFIKAPVKGYSLTVLDPMNKPVFESKDITLSDFGAFDGEFKIPETGVSGHYLFELKAPFLKVKYYPVRMLVSDFTPSPFYVESKVNSKYFKPGDVLEIATSARLHSEGAYGNASARVNASLKMLPPSQYFKNDNNIIEGFFFYNSDQDSQLLHQEEGTLDNNGDMLSKVKIPEKDILFGNIIVESAVSDDRGKYTAANTTARYAAMDRFVGLKPENTSFNKDSQWKMKVIVVDEKGNPVSGVPVNVMVENEKVTITEYKNKWNAVKKRSSKKWQTFENTVLQSSDEPFEFSFTPETAEQYRVTATVKDTRGREHKTVITHNLYWPVRYDRQVDANNTLEIIPEKTSYKVGETARYEIKNPPNNAKMLVSIERYGILKHWVQTLDKDNPVFEFKIKKDFIPGFHLSAVLMSPGDDSINAEGQEKNSHPFIRSAYLTVNVSGPDKTLKVQVIPEKETYKPGDHVRVNLKAVPEYGKKEEPVELAVAVLNEEVLALISDDLVFSGELEQLLDELEGEDSTAPSKLDYFNPYKGFFKLGRLDMENYNLLKRLLGGQKGPQGTLYGGGSAIYDDDDSFTLEEIAVEAPMKFDKVNSYGGGAKEKKLELRSDLKFISYWNPSVITDKNGNASIEFDTPDNLTGWRVIALAVTPTDKMGLGDGSFAVNKDTEIRPVMPNQVTEGDSFKAGFSIMNRTDKTRELTIKITAQGAIEANEGQKLKQVTKSVTAEPYKRIPIFIEIKAKGSGSIKFTAEGGDAEDMDGLVHELEVRKMASLETAATYGTIVKDKITESIHFPEAIRTDVGSVNVNLSPTVIGQVEGAFKYMRDYPYTCWEQSLSKGVMAAHYLNLKQYMPDDFIWEGSEGLPKSMLEKASSFQASNGGMTYYIAEDRYVSPYLSAYTALAFTWLKERGYDIPEVVNKKLNEYLLDFIQKKEKPSFYSNGMASTVRAVALAALAKQGEINRGHISLYYSHLKEMDLFGKAHFLLAAVEVRNTEEIQKEIFKMILSHADQTSGKYVFNEAFGDGYSRILTSSLRSNAAVLSSLAAYGKTEEGKELVGDIPFKLVRYITQTRKQSGRWENTQENIFCMNALVEYSKAYENIKPNMKITAMLGKNIMGKAKFKDVRDEPIEMNLPIKKDDPGRKTDITIERKGKGRLYYSAGLTYAPLKLNTDPVNAGIDIKREYSVERNGEWIMLKSPMKIKRGELVRVDLFVSLPAARNFVVVDDPIPGGLEPVNSDLATSSQIDADKGKFKPVGGSWWFHYGDWSYYGMSRWSFYHRELRHYAVRFYSEYLPAGNYHLSYTAQAIAPGEFTVMPSHAEEMYDPDVFGKSGAGILNIKMEN